MNSKLRCVYERLRSIIYEKRKIKVITSFGSVVLANLIGEIKDILNSRQNRSKNKPWSVKTP